MCVVRVFAFPGHMLWLDRRISTPRAHRTFSVLSFLFYRMYVRQALDYDRQIDGGKRLCDLGILALPLLFLPGIRVPGEDRRASRIVLDRLHFGRGTMYVRGLLLFPFCFVPRSDALDGNGQSFVPRIQIKSGATAMSCVHFILPEFCAEGQDACFSEYP